METNYNNENSSNQLNSASIPRNSIGINSEAQLSNHTFNNKRSYLDDFTNLNKQPRLATENALHSFPSNYQPPTQFLNSVPPSSFHQNHTSENMAAPTPPQLMQPSATFIPIISQMGYPTNRFTPSQPIASQTGYPTNSLNQLHNSNINLPLEINNLHSLCTNFNTAASFASQSYTSISTTIINPYPRIKRPEKFGGT